MKKLFPTMYDCPEKQIIASGITCWLGCYMLVPFVITVMLAGSYQNGGLVAGFDIGYFVLNFLVMAALFFGYLRESVLNIRVYTGRFWGTVAIGAGIMAVSSLMIICAGMVLGLPGMVNHFPITETSVLTTASYMVMKHPLAGTAVAVLLSPVTISCMFYSTVFAPVSVNKGNIAYLVMAAALLLPRLFNIWWLGNAQSEILIYIMHLPFHMIACWTYQRTDTVWAPIASLGICNLAAVGLIMWFTNMGLFAAL